MHGRGDLFLALAKEFEEELNLYPKWQHARTFGSGADVVGDRSQGANREALLEAFWGVASDEEVLLDRIHRSHDNRTISGENDLFRIIDDVFVLCSAYIPKQGVHECAPPLDARPCVSWLPPYGARHLHCCLPVKSGAITQGFWVSCGYGESSCDCDTLSRDYRSGSLALSTTDTTQ
jgi:hypothetical protein